MKIHIELSENDIRSLIRDYIKNQVGEMEVAEKDIEILVKSKQNYRSEWEPAKFKATFKSHKLKGL